MVHMDRKRWDTLRFTLGMMQMAAATVAAILLVRTGVSTWALTAAVTACVLTTISVLIFGTRRPRAWSQTHTSRRR